METNIEILTSEKRTASKEVVGPAGLGSHEDDLDASFLGTQREIDDYTKRFLNLNREAPV